MLAVIVSRGAFNNLVQVATLLMAAVGSGLAVRVFFRDEAVLKVTKAGAAEVNLSDAYRDDAEGCGDGFRRRVFWISQRSGAPSRRPTTRASTSAAHRWPSVGPGPKTSSGRLTAFLLEDVAAADHLLSF